MTPVPEFRSVFPKESAVSLPLKGDRWKQLLKHLATSNDGCTANKCDLFVALDYLSQTIKDEDIEEIRDKQGRMSEIKSVSQRLTQAIGDLNRELRDCVVADDDEPRRNPPMSVSDPKVVRSKFTCRYLLRDEQKFRFGDPK